VPGRAGVAGTLPDAQALQRAVAARVVQGGLEVPVVQVSGKFRSGARRLGFRSLILIPVVGGPALTSAPVLAAGQSGVSGSPQVLCCSGTNGFWLGTDGSGPTVSGSAPYQEPQVDATYGVYVGEIGGWWDMPGVGSSCGYAHFLFANINAANVNLANYWYGVGAGAFWFMGGPGMDPNYGTYGGTAKEAWTWGVLQAQTALSLYNSSPFSPGFNFPVLFMDIEKATTSATTDGSNAVATPGSCGSTRLLDLWRHDGDLLHDSPGQRDALEQSAPPGSSNGPGHPAGGHPRLPQQLPSLGAGKKRVTPCPAGGWMNSGREGESGPCDRTTPEVLRGAEDVMGADPAPDDVRLTSLDFGSELPGGPTVRRERHLHDVAGALQGLHPETGPEWPTRFQILDKPGNGNTKPLLLVSAKRSPVVIKSREPLVGGHLPK